MGTRIGKAGFGSQSAPSSESPSMSARSLTWVMAPESCVCHALGCQGSGIDVIILGLRFGRGHVAAYSTNEFRSGLKVLLEGEPCSILQNEFVKPGKGQAFNRVRFRNLKSGRVWERTFKSGESIEAADVMDLDMQYLYSDGEFWHFMRTDGSYEQVAANRAAVDNAKDWLKEEDVLSVTLWNDEPISVTPPNFVELEVTQTDPGIRGDTAQGGSKPAELSTGAIIKVPLFVEIGDILRVDTRNGEYVGRTKD